ncbi:MAG: molecular chaperone HtpG [Bacteroidales bacterium]|nr:molecular chaperone HtpG [Bacteroidales bacterium]MDY2592391.1 molecular chaperone HtpG [Sodaliphilus sp.]MCI6902120.1 molecular chaperone HtpG [Bacteroidales bacterium]MDD7018914.1 molecular chaperone HtpG [Bacteroidales bacterium]MDD7715935.1 molecular chaperone HtpG [Bacteroidales bacterium]
MAKGSIGVTTSNIFPVIKQFLYSDHEIFLREIVSNAVDATQKLKTLANAGEFKGKTDDLKVSVKLDTEAGTLTVSDNGIGMTAEEIDKYINQIAFSGAEDFLNKFKDNANAIIGHFGLGFYSAFMVSKKVEIHTLSYKEGAKAMKWTCDGSPEYDMEECEKAERGTDIVMYIDDEEKEYLEKNRISALLNKYCRFMPVPVIFGKEQEWKDGKYVDTDTDKVINNIEPLWTRTPTELKDEDYIKFYHAIQPGQEDPLFWIHLNVDFPFTLTGILYFPKIKNNLDVRKDRIQLYCNQVFVTDSVEGVVPDFMMLLQGVIDSPDIPLNVSRSYLQADRNVKKISTYITKKVAARLEELSKKDTKAFEEKWNDIKIFIEYGMLSDEKFCEQAMKFALVSDTEGQFFKLDDYKKLIEGNQTDKDGNLVYLYATDKEAQYSYIKAANDKGYNVLMMDGQLDIPFVSMLEQKNEKSRFVRVDSDVIDNLIRKEDDKKSELSADEQAMASTLFKSQIPAIEKSEFYVSFAALAATDQPVVITQSEYMRRMKEMAQFQSGMNFYGELPNAYNLTLNTNHPVVKKVIEAANSSLEGELKPVNDELKATNSVIEAIKSLDKDGKGVPEDKKADLKTNEDKATELRAKKDELISKYAAGNDTVKQLIDIALLGNGLLKGEALSNFLKRSVSLL